ncbi:hypothetical protein TTHERM_00127240 (macronuclear) [Tetrahymena thermophila SB210]|uniref:Transmembrane protein n=1 Tax=Tetrahymena thermophila (strain SB210) TaxID=312017 RepID=I7MEC3_TETTS|nr:hypothetical protein TTHERM_00127240 [Tetrahymena thermophila SB210]EAR96059.1 hypothetical protein TTHERM_00127240 [Tetrahymena thermophila SB210]|eukprot:XP_001016304.1 hypothetical protein TTHERM_00127240 [Tetrahymena thermophila SB210]
MYFILHFLVSFSFSLQLIHPIYKNSLQLSNFNLESKNSKALFIYSFILLSSIFKDSVNQLAV